MDPSKSPEDYQQQQQTSREFPPADDHGRCGGDLICVLISLLAPINGLYHPVHSSNEAEIQIASGRDWIGWNGMSWLGLSKLLTNGMQQRYQYYYGVFLV